MTKGIPAFNTEISSAVERTTWARKAARAALAPPTMKKIIDWLEENIWWPVERALQWPGDQINELKWFFQRGKRGWSDSDLWSLDWYLTSWMPEALFELKKNQHGYPSGLSEKKWNKILDGMIAGFKADRKIKECEYETVKQYKKLDKARSKGLKLFAEYYGGLWD